MGKPVRIRIESGLPWNGNVRIYIRPEKEEELTIHTRLPSWQEDGGTERGATASGYDPRQARFDTVCRVWSQESEPLEYNFDLSIKLRHAPLRVKGHAGKVAVTRGPLVYCLESLDHPHVDIFTARLDPASLQPEFVPDLLGGCVVLHGKTTSGQTLKFIPYFLWANRGESQMTVWVHCKKVTSVARRFQKFIILKQLSRCKG